MVTGDLQAGDTVGEYRIERTIGAGSFGKVYAAIHPMIGKRAAIKVLGFEHSQSPQFVSRFLEEARAVNKIRHRNIVDIFSFGQLDDGRHYLVMELLEGKPMGEWLAERGSIPPHEALPVLRKVARALEAAHKHGIAHRDLKPDNIFLTFDEEGVVFPVLLDFGIAKLMGDGAMGHKTQTGMPMGTPLYMSPEQCRGSHMDHRTDIYSFGVVAFEMLTGRRPFDSDNVMEILMAHLSQRAPTMASVNAAVPAALDPPIEKMLEKEPQNRPPSITIAIEALIASARSVGVDVPSSRDSAISGFGGTAPMSGPPVHAPAVPERPPTLDPTLAGAAMGTVQPARSTTTKQSPVVQAPLPAQSHPIAFPASTHAAASMQPADTAIAPPPPRPRPTPKRGPLLFVLAGVAMLVLVVGGLYAASRGRGASDETETDDDSETDGEETSARADRKRRKSASEGTASLPGGESSSPSTNGVPFNEVVLPTGAVAHVSEATVFTFNRVDSGKSRNLSSTNKQVWQFDVLRSAELGVERGKIAFTVFEENLSVDHAKAQTTRNPAQGQSYEVERQAGGVIVTKAGGALTPFEQKDVEQHTAGLMGPNLFAGALKGKKLSIGERIELPFDTLMRLLGETDRTRFPKLVGSMTLQKVAREGAVRVGVFSSTISFEYNQEAGDVFKSDMTGTISVAADTAWVMGLEMYGPLNIDSADAKVSFEPGTFNYSYTVRYQ